MYACRLDKWHIANKYSKRNNKRIKLKKETYFN